MVDFFKGAFFAGGVITLVLFVVGGDPGPMSFWTAFSGMSILVLK